MYSSHATIHPPRFTRCHLAIFNAEEALECGVERVLAYFLREECWPPLTATAALRPPTHAWRNLFTRLCIQPSYSKKKVVSSGWPSSFSSILSLYRSAPFVQSLLPVYTIIHSSTCSQEHHYQALRHYTYSSPLFHQH